MPVVRYVALAALVLWLAGLLDALVGEVIREREALAYGCGAVLLVAYLAMKFVGPPPRAFKPRLALVILMLLVAIVPAAAPRAAGRAALVADAVLGAVLLFWYSRE